MMGLPPGWVTDPAIWQTDVPTPAPGVNRRATASGARNAQLKALGNGVVPQQAALATRLWLASCASEVAA